MPEPKQPESWVEIEFTAEEADHMCQHIPLALARAQQQASNAHDGFDPEGTELYVYGTAMSRADHAQVTGVLAELPSFDMVKPRDAKREVLRVGGKVILVRRVGTKMPRRIDRIRLKRVSPYMEGLLSATSMVKYDEVLDIFREPVDAKELDLDESELDFLKSAAAKNSLIVVFYSSSPSGIGSAFWAPAIFGKRNHLRFKDPQQLSMDTTPGQPIVRQHPKSEDPDAFGAGTRPETPAKLRPRSAPLEA